MADSEHRSALQIDHPQLTAKWPENTTQALLKHLEWSDFNFKLKGTSWLTEGFNFHLFNQDGSALFLQIAYSNLAWPSSSVVVSVRYYSRNDAKIYAFQETYSGFRMKRRNDRLSVKVASTQLECLFETDLEHPKFVFNHKNNEFKATLEIRATQKPIQVGHGETRYGRKGSDGYLLFQFVPSVSVKGELQSGQTRIPIMGRGVIIHQFQGVRPNIASTRFDVTYFSQVTNKEEEEEGNKDIDLFMVQFHTPKKYGDCTVNVGFMTEKGELVALSTGKEEMFDAKKDTKTGYPLPTRIVYNWSGTDILGKSFEVCGTFIPKSPTAKIDILAQMPFFVRKAVQILVASPYVYKYVDDAEFSVRIGEQPPKSLTGSLYHEISFLNKE